MPSALKIYHDGNKYLGHI